MVLLHQGAMGRVNPETNGEGINSHGNPLKEDGSDWQPLSTARAYNIVDADRYVTSDQGPNDKRNPDIEHGCVADGLSHLGQLASEKTRYGFRPYIRAVNSRNGHDGAGDKDTLRRTIEPSEIERVCMICFPCGEEHGEARAESGVDTGLGGSETHGSSFQKTAQGAVQRVYSVVKEFTQTARSTSSASLFAVDIVHGLVHEKAECETEV